MDTNWTKAKASDVEPGDRIRTADGTEMTATHVEKSFMGRETMLAFIEDTPDRWFKRPMPLDAELEVLSTTT